MPSADTPQPAVSARELSAAPSAAPAFSAAPPASLFTRLPWRRWLVRLGLLCLAIALAGGAASWLVQRGSVRARLNARLEAAFGRPVQVDRYGFSLWDGPTLEADGVRVAEDPRFGNEYFLRADSLALRLHWLALLRGRFELGTLSLTGPTLNVVRNSAGDWNLAEWLGHPAAGGRVGPVRPSSFVPRFRQIRVEGGRINFKRGDAKLPFAFEDVTGSIGADGAERWRLDLDAAPWRAAELLQQAGTIHLAGSIGGTSSALRPASLQITWQDASVSDFLRLASGDDFGVRGSLALALNAQTASAGAGWDLQAHADLGQLHRWDLAGRPDNPSLSLNARATLDLAASHLAIPEAELDATRANLRGSADVSWAQPRPAAGAAAQPVVVRFASGPVDSGDLLAWLRAFRPGVAGDLSLLGTAQVHGTLSGWPLRFSDFALATSPLRLSGARLRSPVELSPVDLRFAQRALLLFPAALTLGGPKGSAPSGLFRLEIDPPAPRRPASSHPAGELLLEGSAPSAADVVSLANAFGWDVAGGWQVAGFFHCDLAWPDPASFASVQPVGTIVLGGPGDQGASLRAGFLNLPIAALQARVDFKPGSRHITLVSAAAFGARWNGTLDFDGRSPDGQFSLSADRIEAADLDRWLNPRWRESFLDRMLPFLNSAAPPADVAPDSLRGAGHLAIGVFSAPPFLLDHLAGDLQIAGRQIALSNLSASAFGGKIVGSLDASLAQNPRYRGRATFSGVDLASLQTPPVFSGSASGEADFSMQGGARADLASSLACTGALDVRKAAWLGVDLLSSAQAARLIPGSAVFNEASGRFSCVHGSVSLADLVFSAPHAELEGAGSVDFSRNINLELHPAPQAPATPVSPRTAAGSVILTGTLAAPQFGRAGASRRVR